MHRALAFAAILLACMAPSRAATLTVAVAANVQYAFAEVAAAFEQETGHQIRPVYNSSGKLTAQVMHGAPFDVFLSADMEYPEKLHREGLTLGSPAVYAHGTLVLWTLNAFDLSEWRQLLTSKQVRSIAIANPKVAPYGREAVSALAHLGLKTVLRPKLIYGESVSQVNQYTHSRAADLGITAKAVVMAPEMRDQGRWVDLPPESYRPIAQGVVVLKSGAKTPSEAAISLRDFTLSPRARAIFSRYGYQLP